MKKITSLVFAALLGGLFTLGGFYYLGFNEHTIVQVNKQAEGTAAPVQVANMPNTFAAGDASLDFTRAAEMTTPAVVHIQCTKKVGGNENNALTPESLRDFFGDDFFGPFRGSPHDQGGGGISIASGSGVIIESDGLIVTNHHVIKGADEIEVTMNDNRSYSARLIGKDPSTDLAVLKIDERGLPFLPIGNSDQVKVGEWVLAVGNPFNLASTVTAGIVSAKARNINILDDQSAIESFIQTDAAVNSGNSGGALVNLEGELIGINSAIATPTGTYTGYSFAVPSNIMYKVVGDLKDFGMVQRAYLGVMIKDLDNDLADQLSLNITEGVYVDALSPNSAAAVAGIQAGDVIVAIDGSSVKSSPELQETIGRKRPGDDVEVTINRKGSEKNLTVNLRNMDGNTELTTLAESNGVVVNRLGATLAELSPSELASAGVSSGVQISSLGRGRLKDSTDIREGFIITNINNREVSSVEEALSALRSNTGGILLEGVYPGSSKIYYYGFGM